MTAPARPPGRRPPLLDGRLLLALALLLGLLVWRGGPLAAAAEALGFAGALAAAGRGRRAVLRSAAGAAAFALPWGAVRVATALAAGPGAAAALAAGGTLALRLTALLLLGAALTALLPPRALGLAAASLARPVLGRRAWEAALALALMVHFVPRARARFQEARAALRLRRVKVSRPRAALLVLQAGTRNLAVGTWDQTLALAARRLDRPEAWPAGEPLQAREVMVAVAVAGAALALAAW
ncbi:hypothetical protein [Anaeromyxobacter diazotrophicus]|uniref:Cobalt transport protein n=1 Tax=Anaeromyxobacter diazotrophicus TaxID=2590199 RepID=A0A7I9VRY8_9BACT|nr:hypothetical protein [Anaeromyxobacter diazotrophicus]GEJ59131.1 hypothetical protein AMYX_38720 [Anaeromyxobacter diazotrophicus]